MFLFPLSHMTGSVYYEHAHRLLGSLIGIGSLLCLAFAYLHSIRIKHWFILLFMLVVAQGVMGGLRVTMAHTGSGVEIATALHETVWSSLFAVSHGICGQLTLALVAYLYGMTALLGKEKIPVPKNKRNNLIAELCVFFILIQLIFGVLHRQISFSLHPHLAWAFVTFAITMHAGMFSWSRLGELHTSIRCIGLSLSLAMLVQFTLGFVVWGITAMEGAGQVNSALVLILPTLHQSIGAIILALAVINMVYLRRIFSAESTVLSE